MTRGSTAPHREWRRATDQAPTQEEIHQLSGYESPQRRRYLRALADESLPLTCIDV